MLIIFTGNGKGKTTAALGQAMRAVGGGKRVLMVQFIKGPWKSGEDVSHKMLSPFMKIVKKGKGFVGICGDKLPREEHEQAAKEGLDYAKKEIETKKWNIVILDEIWNALSLGLLESDDISNFIDENLAKIDHLIMTGRNCPKEFIDRASLVTEMVEIKHPFNLNVKAAQGVEF